MIVWFEKDSKVCFFRFIYWKITKIFEIIKNTISLKSLMYIFFKINGFEISYIKEINKKLNKKKRNWLMVELKN